MATSLKENDLETDYGFLLQVSKKRLLELDLLEEYIKTRGIDRFDSDGYDYITILQAKLIGIIKTS